MKELTEKLGLIISQLLLISAKVMCIYKPTYYDSKIHIAISDNLGNKKVIEIPYSKITKVHDHTLETYIFEIFRDNELL